MARTRTHHGGRRTRRRRVMTEQHKGETDALKGALWHARANLARHGLTDSVSKTGGRAGAALCARVKSGPN